MSRCTRASVGHNVELMMHPERAENQKLPLATSHFSSSDTKPFQCIMVCLGGDIMLHSDGKPFLFAAILSLRDGIE